MLVELLVDFFVLVVGDGGKFVGVGAIINRLSDDTTTNHPHMVVKLSEYGQIIRSEICKISAHYEGVVVDKHVVMPNHTVSTIIQQLTGLKIATRVGWF
ncbi:MAG: hypothetical protein FWE19_07480 [Oscillospiraceae bacterium]|nr:hypothetical protein [Oscillospiraceae bacterium]